MTYQDVEEFGVKMKIRDGQNRTKTNTNESNYKNKLY